MDRARLKAELIRDEGKKLIAYKDSVGLWTIGIGHLLGEQERMTEVTEDECTALFWWDVQLAEDRVRALVPQYLLLNDVRQRALVNMSFNLGNRLVQFKRFLAHVNRAMDLGPPSDGAEWTLASNEMLNSKWASQVKGRATRLSEMIRTGVAA